MQNKRILLIEPPFYRLYGENYALVKYPLSLAYLALAVREKTDWEVKVLNGDFAPSTEPFDVTYLTGEGFRRYTENIENTDAPIWKSIRSVLSDYQPSVVGVSVKSSTLASACQIARIVKEMDSKIMVIAGGPHPSATGPEMLTNTDIDVTIPGEGEETLVDLLRTLEKGVPILGVKGLFTRSGTDASAAPRREALADLDTLGFPVRHAPEALIGYDDYPLKAFGYLFATRGCPGHCLFCGSREVWGRKVRFRSPAHVVREIAFMQGMGLKSFHFDDDTFGVNNAYLQDLCRALETHCPGIAWSCEIHVRLVNEKNIALMKRAGCVTIQLGIESGNNGILKIIRKGFTIEEAIAAGRLITRHDIGLHPFFMAGFPWETEATLLDTRKVIEEIPCEKIIYSLFTPYPGTEAFRLCKAEGLIPENYSPSLFGHQSPLNSFSMNMTSRTFRFLSRSIEETVVKRNRFVTKNRFPDPS